MPTRLPGRRRGRRWLVGSATFLAILVISPVALLAASVLRPLKVRIGSQCFGAGLVSIRNEQWAPIFAMAYYGLAEGDMPLGEAQAQQQVQTWWKTFPVADRWLYGFQWTRPVRRPPLPAAEAKNQKLLDAIEEDDLDKMEALLRQGADVNWRRVAESSRPLNEAMFNHDPQAVALLLKYGADVNAVDFEGDGPFAGETPLHGVPRMLDPPDDVKVAAALLHRGARVNGRSADGRTPLMAAVVWEDSAGRTPACGWSRPDAARHRG